MSVPARKWALSKRTGSSARRAVLNCLADWMIGENAVECWPSIDTIVFETEMNRKTVMKATAELVALGLIGKRKVIDIERHCWQTRYTFIGYVPKEWVKAERPGEELSSHAKESPKNGTYQKRYVPKTESTKNGTEVHTKNGTKVGPKNGTIESPKFGTRTGIEQGITGIREEGKAHASRSLPVAPPPPGLDDEAEAEWNDLTARAALEADSMPEDVFSPDAQTPIENIDARFDTASDSIFGTDTPTENQNAAERKSEAISKPKRRKRVALTLTELPIDWRIYCEKTAPELNPDRVWDDFSDFWQNRAKDPFCVDWSRTWQTNIRKLHALPNNDFRKAPQLKAEIAQAAQAKPSRFMTAQERYEAELDRLGQISDEEYYARIDRAGEEFVRRDKERAARLAQEKAKKEKKL